MDRRRSRSSGQHEYDDQQQHQYYQYQQQRHDHRQQPQQMSRPNHHRHHHQQRRTQQSSRHQRQQARRQQPHDQRRAAHPQHQEQRQIWFAEDYHPIRNGSIDGTDVIPHDKGLIRAMRTKFDPSQDPKIQGNPYCTLFVGRLNYETTESTLRDMFGRLGRIRSLRIVRDIVTQRSKGYAFIEYEREADFRRAYYRMHNAKVDGFKILVEFERARVMKGWKPRRLGGGLGGRKESGQLRFGGRAIPFRVPLKPELLDKADEMLEKCLLKNA